MHSGHSMGLSGAPSLTGACSAGSKSVSPVAAVSVLRCPPCPRSQRIARDQHDNSLCGAMPRLAHGASRKVSGARLLTSCSSSMTLEGALSSYDIPKQTDSSESMPRWLSTCISEAAKHLDQAPFLQLLISSGTQAFERHRVTTAVVQAPQLWQGIAEHLAKSSPEVLVLIHPIHMTPSSHSQRAISAARESRGSAPDVLTGIAVNGGANSAATWDAKHTSRMETVARQMASSMGPYALEGRVGDCCDDEELPNMQSRAQQHAHHTAQSTNREHDPVTGQEIEYWGVVVQTEDGSAADGCYVLKTVQNRDPAVDCTCVHYSLVSVCKGEPYSAQMASSWLI